MYVLDRLIHNAAVEDSREVSDHALSARLAGGHQLASGLKVAPIASHGSA
jgi:hypothetical protein